MKEKKLVIKEIFYEILGELSIIEITTNFKLAESIKRVSRGFILKGGL